MALDITVTAPALFIALLFIDMFIVIFINAAMKLVVREMIMIVISNEFFHLFFFLINGFNVLAELDKRNEFERSLACGVCFVCASQKT